MALKLDRTVRRVHDRWQRERRGLEPLGAACAGAAHEMPETGELEERVASLRAFGGAFAHVKLSPFLVSDQAIMAGCIGGGVDTDV